MLSDIIITDDSGFLALVDVSTYEGFIGDEWNFDTLKVHIQSQAKLGRIAFWACGDGGDEYRVRRISEPLSQAPILDTLMKANNQGFYLVSYTALTMAAQFEDERLPAQHENKLRLDLEEGKYRVQVYQHYDPDDYKFTGYVGLHFSLRLTKLS